MWLENMVFQKFEISKTFFTCLAQMCFLGNCMIPFEMNSQTIFLLKNFATFLTRMVFTSIFWTFVIIKIGALSTILTELFKVWNIMKLEFMLQTCWKKIMNKWINEFGKISRLVYEIPSELWKFLNLLIFSVKWKKLYIWKIPGTSQKTLMDPKLSPERSSTNSNELLINSR